MVKAQAWLWVLSQTLQALLQTAHGRYSVLCAVPSAYGG